MLSFCVSCHLKTGGTFLLHQHRFLYDFTSIAHSSAGFWNLALFYKQILKCAMKKKPGCLGHTGIVLHRYVGIIITIKS